MELCERVEWRFGEGNIEKLTERKRERDGKRTRRTRRGGEMARERERYRCLSIEARLLDGIIAWGVVKLQSHMQLVVRGLARCRRRRRRRRQQGVRQA